MLLTPLLILYKLLLLFLVLYLAVGLVRLAELLTGWIFVVINPKLFERYKKIFRLDKGFTVL